MQEKESLSPDVVRSIFNKRAKKKPSSLFGADKGSTAKKSPSEAKEKKALHAGPIGIDIGSSAVKVAQVHLKNNVPSLSMFSIRELPHEAVNNPEERKRVLPVVLREIVRENNLKGEVYSAMSTNTVQIKNITLPAMPLNEVDGAIRWEVQQLGGARIENIAYDYVILNKPKRSGVEHIEALVVISAKENILEHIKLLESAGLRALAVEVDSFSLFQNLDFAQATAPDEVVIALDCGAEATRMNMITNKELRFVRMLSTGGGLLTRNIRDYCGVSYKEAEVLKRQYGLSSLGLEGAQQKYPIQNEEKAVQVKNAIYLSVEKLLVDIERTFKYFSYQLTRSEITKYDRVILSGGSAHLKMFASFLGSRLNVPVEVHDPLKGLSLPQGIDLVLRDAEHDTARLGVAVGAALRAIER